MHGGDPTALAALLERNLDWIHQRVSRRLGPVLRKKGETCDYVQDAMVQFLRYGPRIQVNDEGHFRALLARIVENTLSDQHDWFTRARRRVSREHPLPGDSVLSLDEPRDTVTTPSKAAQHHEEEALIRLGMELLDPEDRNIIALRQWENLPFHQIGERLGITPEAAGKRHNRAVARLAKKVGALRRGDLRCALDGDS